MGLPGVSFTRQNSYWPEKSRDEMCAWGKRSGAVNTILEIRHWAASLDLSQGNPVKDESAGELQTL
jgi:hypothetical protein